jgi:transposase
MPDREASTFATWLIAHPGVEIISRDRGGNYAEGAPQAEQTTDRWHLLKNLGEALESFFLSQKTLRKRGDAPTRGAGREHCARLAWHMGGAAKLEGGSCAHHQKRVERHEQIHALAASQVPVARIARQLGVSRQTVYTELRRTHPPERRRISLTRPRLLAPYESYLLERWNQGCRNGQQLYREIQARGYPGSVTDVTRFVSQLCYHKGTARSFKAVEPTPKTVMSLEEASKPRLPTALQVARWMTLTNEQRLDWQNEYLARLCQADVAVARSYDLTQEFAQMLRERQGERLDAWMDRVEAQAIPELRTFAQGQDGDERDPIISFLAGEG